ncbi:MAG: mRNA surveillance protein pelota [Candidatus Micrarchaeota archaeon]
MRITGLNETTGELRVMPENTEDLWHIERVLEPGDLVKARSLRRFKVQEGESGEKKQVTIELEAKKIEFHKNVNVLRVMGVIKRGTPEEFVQVGSYHTIDVEPMRKLSITKKWKKYQFDRLKKAQTETKRPRLGIVVMDEREAAFALLRGYGIDFTSNISAATSKRDDRHDEHQNQFFGNITSAIQNMEVERIIVAGPGFAKDNLKRFISNKDRELLKKLSFEHASSAEKSGVYELLKNGVVEKIVGEQRVEREFRLMERLMAEVSKGTGLAAYGKAEVGQATEHKAAKELFVVDDVLRQDKEMEEILAQAERQKCEITIFSAENNAGKQLQGIGGIAAILRFPIN